MSRSSSGDQARGATSGQPDSAASVARRPLIRPDIVWLLVAAGALVAGLLGFRQAPDPDPFRTMPDPWTLEGFLHPVERNAFLRLPEIAGDLIDVTALPDGQHVWLLSADNALAHSADGGEHWAQLPPISESPASPPAASAAPGTPAVPPVAPATHSIPAVPPDAAQPAAAPAKASEGLGLISAAHAGELPPQAQQAPAKDPLAYPEASPATAGNLLDLTQAPNAANPARPGTRRVPDKLARPEGSARPTPDKLAAPEPLRAAPSKVERKEPPTSMRSDASTTKSVPARSPASPVAQATAPAIPLLNPDPMSWLSIGGIAFTDPSHGVAVGTRSPDLLRIGTHWQGPPGFVADTRTLAVVMATEDGGQHWSKVFEQPAAGLRHLRMFASGFGWAVGDGGLIIATRDGGRSWQRQESGYRSTVLTAVSFVDDQHGWVASDAHVLLVTSDGGAHWASRKLTYGGEFSSLDFGDLLHGCAVVEQIEAVERHSACTRDGGISWRTVPEMGSFAADARFVDSNHVVAIASSSGGYVAVSGDAGLSWQRVKSGATPWAGFPLKLRFSSDRRGWAIGSDGLVMRTDDGGAHWTPLTRSSGLEVSSLFFLDRRQGWAAGAGMGILATEDGGETWRVLTRRVGDLPDIGRPTQIQFVDAQHGWVSTAGQVQLTADGGLSWSAPAIGMRHSVLRFHFTDPMHGWLVTDELRADTRDGGQTWQVVPSGLPKSNVAIRDAVYPAPGVGLAIDGSNSGIWTQSAADSHWDLSFSGMTWAGARRLEFSGPQRGWLLKRDGMLATQDGGQHWANRPTLPPVPLDAAALGTGASGWVVGAGGTVLHTIDDGLSWQSASRPQGSAAALRAVWADASGRQVVVGGAGALFASRDGGRSWDGIRYRWYPAPWAWLALGCSVLASFRGWRASLVWQRRAHVVARSIEYRGASDAAIDHEDRDRLAFGPIARALARFLQNRNSEAPMVLAVTGKWGSGKSSLMNLLRGELRTSFNVRPVWFNAWHHQSEENLLSALLENIRQQAVPPLGSAGGLPFRYALGMQRLRSRCLPALAWLGLGLFVLAYLDTAPPERLGAWFGLLGDLVKDADLAAQGALVGNASRIVVAAVAIFKISAGLRAFGVNPATLMASTSQNFKLRDASAQAGFRFQFEREFAEVTSALERSDRRMVIFIDDLDRCQPEKVVQVLESINFLVSAGRCFVILGMDREYIVSAVGLSFERIATEMAGQTPEPPDAARGAPASADPGAMHKLRQRQQFAERYVQKMLNIEIPIPSLDPEMAEALFLDEAANANRQPPPRRFSLAALGVWLAGARGLIRTCALLLLLAAAWKAGTCLERYVAPVPAPLAVAKPATPAVVPGMTIQWQIEPQTDGSSLIVPKAYPLPGLAGTGAGAVTGAVSPPGATVSGGRAAVTAHEPGPAGAPDRGKDTPAVGPVPLAVAPGLVSRPGWQIDLPVLPLLLVLATAIYVLSRQRREVIEDSPAFEKARRIWSALVIRRSRNPREIKRFNNRVRYFAMRLANDGRQGGSANPDSEALLVALAALQHARGQLDLTGLAAGLPGGTAAVDDPLADATIDAVLDGDGQWAGLAPSAVALDAVARDCVLRHRAAGLAWPPPADLVQRFQRWSQGIVT